ncbi:MAG: protein rhiA, partial [Acidobacteriota bacterium]
FCKAAAPTTEVEFNWTIDYSFVWSEEGVLTPGVVFKASQTWDANLTSLNQISLNKLGAAYTFQDQQQGPRSGTLSILQSNLVTPQQASVGIGMSGFGTFAVPGQPNVTAMFTPHPEYWITFGKYQQGEVLDITTITESARIQFPANVSSMDVTLNADNTWTVAPS